MTTEKTYTPVELAALIGKQPQDITHMFLEGNLINSRIDGNKILRIPESDAQPLIDAFNGKKGIVEEYLKIPEPIAIKAVKEPTEKKQELVIKTPVNKAVEEAATARKTAEDNLKAREAELKLDAINAGYNSIQEWIKATQAQKEESDKILEANRKESQALGDERVKIEEDKQKVILAYKKVKDTEKIVDERLKKALELEDGKQEDIDAYNTVIDELRVLIDYHRDNIIPCLNTIKSVNNTMNKWLEILEQSRTDFSRLTNWVHKQYSRLDKYIEVESKIVDTSIVDKDS